MHFGEHGESGETSSADVRDARKSRHMDVRMVDSEVVVMRGSKLDIEDVGGIPST
jgi:hypothetical protein